MNMQENLILKQTQTKCIWKMSVTINALIKGYKWGKLQKAGRTWKLPQKDLNEYKCSNDPSYTSQLSALIIKNHLSAMHIDRERNPEKKRVDTQSAFQRLNNYMYLHIFATYTWTPSASLYYRNVHEQHVMLLNFLFAFIKICGLRFKISNEFYTLIIHKISLYYACNYFSCKFYIKK